MRILIVLILFTWMNSPENVRAQVTDADLIKSHIQFNSGDESPQKGFFFRLYKNHVSEQILNDCIYDHSCSTFAHDVFKNFGFVKGLFLTADRLTRCNRASLAEMSPTAINESGRAKDHWDDY